MSFSFLAALKDMKRKLLGKTPRGFKLRRLKMRHRFHRNMKVIPRSQRHLGINCNKNGVAL